MTLRNLMAKHASETLTRLDHFGEELTYHFEDGTADRTIRAVVNRLGRVRDEDRDLAFLAAEVFIPFDAIDGLEATPAEGDEITFDIELGKTEQRCRIVRTLSSDEGGFQVEVQR